MVKITVYLDDDLALSLKHLAEVEGRRHAELIRDPLKTLTSQRIRPMPTGIGVFHSGYSDTSVRSKDILREAAKRAKMASLTADSGAITIDASPACARSSFRCPQ